MYAEGIVPSAALDTDVFMLQGAQSVKLGPFQHEPWTAYRRAVENYSCRLLSFQKDALNAFSGILQNLCGTDCIEGFPAMFFDGTLTWQPRARLPRREGFPSWSWLGWIGSVHWFDNPDMAYWKADLILKTWIVWYAASSADHQSPAFLVKGPPWLHDDILTKPLDILLSGVELGDFRPTSSLPLGRPTHGATLRREMYLLQFWTFSIGLGIGLDAYAVTRNENSYAENTGRGLRRFVIRNPAGQSCGWVMLDESWIQTTVDQAAKAHEFILLSEVDSSDWQFDRRAFNVMMIVWELGTAVRVGLGQVIRAGLQDSKPVWKEILLG